MEASGEIDDFATKNSANLISFYFPAAIFLVSITMRCAYTPQTPKGIKSLL
jgi:hypothetical protein